MAKSTKISLKAQPSKEKGKEKEVALVIQGELTLDGAYDLKEFLLQHLSKYNHFNIKINNVQNIDLGAVQLIQRFLWDIQQEQKSFKIELKLSDDQRLLLERAGFKSFLTLMN